MSIPDFWDLTFEEISIYIEAKNEEKLDEVRYQATMIHTLGGLVGLATWNDKPYPKIEQVFPELFESECKKQEDEEKQKLMAQMECDQWLAYADAFNKRREVSE